MWAWEGSLLFLDHTIVVSTSHCGNTGYRPRLRAEDDDLVEWCNTHDDKCPAAVATLFSKRFQSRREARVGMNAIRESSNLSVLWRVRQSLFHHLNDALVSCRSKHAWISSMLARRLEYIPLQDEEGFTCWIVFARIDYWRSDGGSCGTINEIGCYGLTTCIEEPKGLTGLVVVSFFVAVGSVEWMVWQDLQSFLGLVVEISRS